MKNKTPLHHDRVSAHNVLNDDKCIILLKKCLFFMSGICFLGLCCFIGSALRTPNHNPRIELIEYLQYLEVFLVCGGSGSKNVNYCMMIFTTSSQEKVGAV